MAHRDAGITMAREAVESEPSKSPRCAGNGCAGPVAVGQTECLSHRLHHPEGRKRLIAELRGEVALEPEPLLMPVPVLPPVPMPMRVAYASEQEAAELRPLPASTLPLARSLWE